MFLSIAAVLILRGPVGKALADRMSGRGPQVRPNAETEMLHAEVEDLRERLAEMEERIDFTERMLARQRSGELPGGG